MSNPLIAPTQDSTKAYSGITLLEDANDLKTAIETGDWASVAMGAVGTALDALSMAMDPFGAILAAGVGWLMEHVGPLKEALNGLTGNADQIAAQSETWKNVAAELGSVATDLQDMVNADLQSWTGSASDAYRQRSQDLAALLGSAQKGTEGAASGVKTAGEVVGAVRALVRDIIADLIGHMISWALQVVFTLGIGLSWVVPQVVNAVAKTASKITDVVTKLVKALKALIPLLKKAGTLFEDAGKALKGLKGGKITPPAKTKDLSGTPDAPPVKSGGADSGGTKAAGYEGAPKDYSPPPASKGADDGTHASGYEGAPKDYTPPPASKGADEGGSGGSGFTGSGTDYSPPAGKGGKSGDDATHASSTGDTPPPAKSSPPPAKTEPAPSDPPPLDPPPTDRGLGGGGGSAGKSGGAKDTTTKQSSVKDANTTPRSNDTPTADRLACGDPIDVSTGRVMLTQEDVRLDAALPLVLTRTHLSSYRIGRGFGASWASTLDQRLEADADGVHFAAEDGTFLQYPKPVVGGEVLPVTGPAWPLSRAMDGSYVLNQPDLGRALLFSGATGRLVTVSTPSGDQYFRFSYDDAGALTDVTHSAGHHVGVRTDDGRVTELTLLSGGAPVVLARFAYDERANLAEVRNSSDRPLRFGYDPEGRLASWEDRNGMWYRYAYDTQGRCVRAEGRDGDLRYRLAYEPRRTTAVDSLGAQTVFDLNDVFQVVAVTDPLGFTTRLEWDDRDRLLSSTDALGATTVNHYDEAGDLVEIVAADGSRTLAEYDDEHRPVKVVEADGAVWLREYTEDGDVAAAVDPLGARTRFEYAAPGRPATVTGPLGEVTRYEYDTAGLPVAVTDAVGATRRTVFDRFGRRAAETTALDAITRTAWTVEGEPLSVTRPDGTSVSFRHDGEGNLRETRAGTTVSRTDYAGFDRPVAVTAVDGSRVELSYDTETRVTAVRNELGARWHYEYDAAGRLAADVDYDGRRRTFRHDAAGRVVEQTSAGGRVLRFGYDALGRIVRLDADGAVATYEYDLAGRLVWAVNDDADLRRTYDAAGHLVTESVNGRVLASAFDASGRRVARTTPTGAHAEWRHDAAGRPIALLTAGRELASVRDLDGREIERRLGTTHLRQAWDARDRLVTQTLATGPGRPVRQRALHYRHDDTVTAVDDSLTGQRQLRRDPVGRPLAVDGPAAHEAYGYDAAGNLVQPGNRAYTGGLLTRDDTATYEYDADGKLVLRRTTDGNEWRYEWDGLERLVAVHTPTGQHWRYRYDALGRRIAKEHVDATGVLRSRTEFTWDGEQLAEQVSDGVRALVWHTEPGSGRVLTQTERVLHQASGDWRDHSLRAVVTDLAGAPTELLDAEQGVVWHGTLTAWGASTGPMPTPLRFAGQYHDEETGLHYNFHRYYDPNAARYLSPDPSGLSPAANPYAYVADPVGWTDPLGLAPCKLSFDQAHSTPAGPSLELRGPRKSGKDGRTPNKVRDEQKFNDIANTAGVPNPHKQRLSFNDDAQTLLEKNRGLGGQLRDQALDKNLVDPVAKDRASVEALGRNDPNTKDFWDQQDRRDRHTASEAVENNKTDPRDAGRDQDVDDRLRPVMDKTEGTGSLLKDHDGVVVGGKHDGKHPGLEMMRDNMGDLKQNGVNKVYLESLRDDAHNGMVKDFLNSPPGTPMHPDLDKYLKANGANGKLVGEVLESAKKEGVDVIGIGGNPARRDLDGNAGLFQRHAMFNSYGAESVRHHQAENPGKYVMEIGEAHAQQHTWSGANPVHIGGDNGVDLPRTSAGIGDILGVPQVNGGGSEGSLGRIGGSKDLK
ncbi:RHS repeat-associated core domain-containing protein [Amycolatopsis rhabdoformis]|uniref:RHS repeat-associated core domain-containing protein n=1 Tax=Amycolatopsis rhabdoformis TaxID=1448059 RepID=A0ABZ1I3N4_9PSEU|nr:RHS repeat-associated core domain-containing protein [Amycolatopsis rhabdoformis]WSE29023.1 RHS repeat-associated core domain-containing protein [Amycolatopsis rhabdoformis]